MNQKISFTLNGEAAQAEIEPTLTLLQLLREKKGLLGTKEGCGAGECGACTVLIEGMAVNSCIFPAREVAGKAVITIEGLIDGEGNLHPIQKAFIEHGAIQCGFCTPGMVLSAKALLEENPHPTDEEIRKGIAGNLCRCTGYVQIVEAIKAVSLAEYSVRYHPCASGDPAVETYGEKPTIAGRLEGLRMSSVIGESCMRIDGSVKVAGQAVYTADLSLPGMLHGKVLGSPHAHARIRAVNLEKAGKLPGVKAVITGKDFPFLHGECIINIPFLAIDRVRYRGEPVVAVAADNPDIAGEALKLVEIEYEELPAVFDPEEAMKPGAPLVHADLGTYQIISAVTLVPGTNICQHFVLSLGDVEKGFRESDYIFEDRFTTPQVQHAAIEPHASIAQVDAAGRITVWGQNDSPHRGRKEIAQALGISQAKIRVITGYVGGNFGGKGGLKTEAVAIALAHKVKGRPVRVVFSRKEVFTTITRSGCIITLKTGVRKDGTIVARHARLIWDVGAYAEKGPTVSLHGGSLATGPYVIPHAEVESFTVLTNKPMAGAMRGYGLPQVAFAYESQMDMIAGKLGIDPLDMRRKNIVGEGSKVVTGQRLYSVGLKECLETVGNALYAGPEQGSLAGGQKLPPGRWVRGKGLACSYKSVKTPSVSAAYVKIDEDGSASVVTSTVEVGQGSHTILMQIVAEVLGVEKDTITVSFADTDVTPYDTSTTSSRSTYHMGNAVLMAAEDARSRLLALAAPLLNAKPDTLQLREGKVWAIDGKSLPVVQVLRAAFGAGAGAAVMGQGVFTPRDILGLEDLGEAKLEAFSTLSAFHSYAVQGAEVAVDLDTGIVMVLRLLAAHDVGKAINPMNCRQQVQGALGMGLGYGLMEEYLWQEGKLMNPDFLNYTMPTSLDCPPMEVFLVEEAHPQGPYGAKGVGEMAIAPTAPAIANAVYNACGVRIKDLPLKPAKVLKQLLAKETEHSGVHDHAKKMHPDLRR